MTSQHEMELGKLQNPLNCNHDLKKAEVRYHGHIIDEISYCTICGFEKKTFEASNKALTLIEDVVNGIREVK